MSEATCLGLFLKKEEVSSEPLKDSSWPVML